MPFEFQMDDESKAFVDDDGSIFITAPGDEPLDIEAEKAAQALGFEPTSGYDLWLLWESILEKMKELNTLDEMLNDIASSGEIKERWQGAYSGHQPYIYEFDTDQLVEYLGPLLKQWVKEDDSFATDLARFLKSLRKQDGSAYEFSLQDSTWEEETQPEHCRLWSAVDRSLWADEIELMEWPEDFERTIWDPVRFESETDTDREPSFEIAASGELPDVFSALGLEKQREKLDEQAAEDAPAPYHPEPHEGGEYGVFYEHDQGEWLHNYNKWISERVIEVIPYYGKYDAEGALEISEACLSDRDFSIDSDGTVTYYDGSQQDYYRMFLVRRLPPQVAEWLRLAREAEIAERKFLLKQTPLFEQDEIPIVEPWDPEIDVWVRPEEYDELVEEFEDE